MKLFFVVTLLHLPNVCSSQHELCRKQIASIFCMNFDKEEIRACRKTVTLRIEGDEVCDASGRCATVLLPCMKLLPPDTTTTTTTEKAAPARVPAEIPEVREAADTTTTTTTEKAEEFGEALASSVKVIVNCVSKQKILSQT